LKKTVKRRKSIGKVKSKLVPRLEPRDGLKRRSASRSEISGQGAGGKRTTGGLPGPGAAASTRRGKPRGRKKATNLTVREKGD